VSDRIGSNFPPEQDSLSTEGSAGILLTTIFYDERSEE